MADPDLGALEAQYNLPPGILAATAHVESRGNPRAVSNQGALGMFQLLPATAKGLGVNDPFDPAQAAVGAAKLWRQNLDRAGGDIDTAAMAYHGGWNQSQWKDKTHAYPGLLASALQNGASGAPAAQKQPASAPDPYLAGLSQGGASTPVGDPYLAGLNGATGSPDGGVSPISNSAAPNGAGNNSGYDAGGSVHQSGDRQAQSSGSSQQLAPRSWGQWAAGLDPATDAAFNGGSFLDGVKNRGIGAVHGADSVISTAEHLGANLIDYGPQALTRAILGHNDKGLQTASDWLRGDATADDTGTANYAKGAVGNSGTYQTGELLGGVAATAPLFELAPFAGGSRAAQLGNLAVQGSASAGATSRGENVPLKMLAGAVAAPVLGTVGEKLAEAASPTLSKIGDAIGGAFGKTAGPALAIPETGAQAGQRIAAMIKSGEPDSVIQDYAAQHGFGGGIDDALAFRAKNGRYQPSVVLQKAPITTDEAKAALGSRGANTGIASNPGLTPEVEARTNELRNQGVPNDEALTQAHIEGIGGKPTTATVTRDSELQSNVNNGSVMHTPEGKAISAQNAGNNQALIDATKGTIESYGGKPEPGEAMEGAAKALAANSDAERQVVRDAYTSAAQTDGDKLGPTDGLKAVVTDPMNRAAATSDAASFINGMGKKLNILDPQGEGLSPQGLEQLRQAANEAMTPTASGALKSLVGKVKGAIDGSFDELGNAGDGYKAARELHSAWADKNENQQGVADLISRDPKGNFINKDSFADKDKWLTAKNDANALQVIRTLKDNGSTGEIDRIKAHVVQNAFDKATSTATDQSRNAVMSGKAFRAQLDNVGQKKLDALFSPDEQSHLAMIGHAASHLNEMVPKTFNNSHSTTTLLNAIDAAQANSVRLSKATAGFGIQNAAIGAAGMSSIGHLTGHELAMALAGAATGVGRRLVEPALAARAAAKSTADLANSIRASANPDVARAADNDNVRKLAATLLARRNINAVVPRSGSVVGQIRNERSN